MYLRTPLQVVRPLLFIVMVVVIGAALASRADVRAQSTDDSRKAHEIIPGTIGIDISWPQCDSQQLPGYHFDWAIIGVNGGRITSRNDCLEGQYEWAKKARVVPQVYMNTNAPQPSFVHPNCGTEDAFCHAYWWGRSHTTATIEYARSKNADPLWWWLDVETGNFWTDHTGFNAQVLAGAIDVLQETGHKIGIYSVPRMWRTIAGDYAPGLPNWTAGAADLEEAKTRCTDQYAFGGGKVVLVQYVSEEFDTNWACPGNVVRRLTIIGAARQYEHIQDTSPPAPVFTPEPTATASPTATSTATATPSPTATSTPTQTATHTPTPTATSTVSPTSIAATSTLSPVSTATQNVPATETIAPVP